MVQGKYLPKEMIAEMVACYNQGWTQVQLVKKFGVSGETIRKAITRVIGPVGTNGRKRREPPHKGSCILSEEVQLKVCALYKEHPSLEKTGKAFGVSSRTVKTILVRHNVSVAKKAPPQKHPDFYCPSCGQVMPRKRVAYDKGTVAPLRTCGDPSCEATMAFSGQDRPPVSRKGTRTDKGGWTAGGKAGYRKRQELEQRLLVQRLEVDRAALAKLFTVEQVGEYEERYELTQDARGVRQPIAQDTLWHGLSRVPVYLRLVARTEGHAAIRLLVPSGYTVLGYFIQKFFGGSVEYAAKINGAFNPLIAWRCSCPEQKTWTLAQLEHLPAEPGVYGVCATCGACALRIEIEK